MSESLIAKLEQSPEGSRELDVAIWHLVETGWQRDESDPGWSFRPVRDPNIGRTTVRDSVVAPSYTTSLDAALQLVPEGWGWLVEVWQREESWAQVVCRPKGSTKPSGIFEGAEAKSPALALCIAALKARAASLKARLDAPTNL